MIYVIHLIMRHHLFLKILYFIMLNKKRILLKSHKVLIIIFRWLIRLLYCFLIVYLCNELRYGHSNLGPVLIISLNLFSLMKYLSFSLGIVTSVVWPRLLILTVIRLSILWDIILVVIILIIVLCVVIIVNIFWHLASIN